MGIKVKYFYSCLFVLIQQVAFATQFTANQSTGIKPIIALAKAFDTIWVESGVYKEGNITIDKPLYFIGKNYPTIDGETKVEVISIKSSFVTFSGFRIVNSGYASLEDPCGIKVYQSENVTISNNQLDNNFFGIYLQYSKNCEVKNNTITAYAIEEQQIGNGIHCWKSDSLQIIGNKIKGHRDGIYFEFVKHSIIWRNIAIGNIRYGLHFMFSNNDSYIGNVFKNNGAGVAVMYTNHVTMINNYFMDNWGDAAYGLLLKEISDSYISGNKFISNTSGIYMEGTSRILVEKNVFKDNGWGMKIQASCDDNQIYNNNFLTNTFDVSTNGTLVLNTFNNNYWDRYSGYDLNKDKIGDVPYHPLSLFAVLVESTPSVMILFRSFFIGLLEKSEKIIPSLTPDNFIDNNPLMRPLTL